MATAAVGAAGSAGVFASVPYVGWVLAIAAAYVDAAYIAPALAGEGKQAAKAPRMLGTPVGSNEAGAPRIWACGARVRVPTHILWQDEKVRESTSGGQKGGTTVQLKRVYIDALIALNDRPTKALQQLRGNGKLLLYKSRNVVSVTTDQMRADSASGTVTVSVLSTLDPAFTDKFQVNDIVQFDGFVHESGDDELAIGYWRVTAVSDHAPGTPSTMDVVPQSGQSISGSAYGGGNPFAQASVIRVDDAIVGTHTGSNTGPFGTWAGSTGQVGFSRSGVGNGPPWYEIFKEGDIVSMGGVKLATSSPGLPGGWSIGDPAPEGGAYLVVFCGTYGATGEIILLVRHQSSDPVVPGGTGGNTLTWEPIGSTTKVLNIVRLNAAPRFTAGIFPATFNPDAYYHSGTETQGEDAILAAAEGTGNVPAYRGVACQGFDSFFATQFGDQLPYSLEALIDVDSGLSWGEACRIVLERAGVPSESIDITGVSSRPFAGMFLRGAVPTITAMQPLLVAGQIIGQERDGTIAMFHVDNADVVQVENGSSFSDFGVALDGGERTDAKILVEDQAEEDLPTSIGIRHQDPDNQYADGYQHFGLRNPSGIEHQNEQEFDLSNIVLTRKEARNLATTTMRRAWINRRKYRCTLPAAYLHVLENDILTFTTDDGDEVRCRVIQRDIGSDFRVSVVAIAEDVELEVSGSPVQSAAGITTPVVITPAVLVAVPLDMPAIADSGIVPPAIKLAVCATNLGQNWAGAQVWESVDGASYTMVGSIGDQAAIAFTESDLTTQAASEEYGTGTVSLRSQTVDVQFFYEGAVALEAATQAEAEAGKNWVAIISNGSTVDSSIEIAAFTTVTPNGGGSYTLGGWLRGLRGTSPEQRDTGSIMVMLYPNQGGLFTREFPGQVLPTSLEYKVVPIGADIDDIVASSVDVVWRNSRPLPVRSISKTIGASPYDARITVDANWTRAVLPPGTQPPHPIDEPFEEYRLDIYDPTGATLVRQKTITSVGTGSSTIRDRWFDYPASEQTADGYTPSGTTTFIVDCVQIGVYGESPSILQGL